MIYYAKEVYMQTYRQIIDIKNGNITFTLPKRFDCQKAEVLIFPLKSSMESNHDRKDIKDLLAVSVWGKGDIAKIKNVQKRLKRWKIKEF